MDETVAAEADIYQTLVTEQSPQLFCDNCRHYPIKPVHGHFVCPACGLPTSCCEGAPIVGDGDENA